MRKSSLDKEKREKISGKVLAMPDKTGGAESREADGGSEGAVDEAPRKGSKKNVQVNEAQEELHKGAKKALRRAVKVEVKKESGKIAEVLVSKVKNGDMRGAQMVLSLMEHGKEAKGKKKKRSGPNLADLPPSEPEWDEEMERLVKQVTEAQETVGTVS